MKTLVQEHRDHSGFTTPSLLLAVAILALLGTGYLLIGSMQKEKERAAQMEQQAVKMQEMETIAAEVQTLRAKSRQLDQMGDVQRELLQLRAEVTALRSAKSKVTELEKENTKLKADLEKLRSTARQASTLQNQNTQLQSALTQHAEAKQKLECLNNLRQIQAAKTAWASDNSKRPIDVPLEPELFGPRGYLPAKPACPTKGTYTLGAAQTSPTCSVPGHSF